MVLLRLACLTWYLQYCVQHQPWRSTWYLQGTQLLKGPNLPAAYCHNQCPKARVSTLPRIFMMMKYWTSVPVYCNYCWGTFHRLKLDKSVDTPRFELWNLNKGETFQAHIETELAQLPPALKLDSSNQNSKLCPWLSEPFFFTIQDLSWEPSTFALQICSSFFLLVFSPPPPPPPPLLFFCSFSCPKTKNMRLFWPRQKCIVINLWTRIEDQVAEPSRGHFISFLF